MTRPHGRSAPWLKSLKARDGDSLLVTIEDWEAGRYRLEHEPAGKSPLR